MVYECIAHLKYYKPLVPKSTMQLDNILIFTFSSAAEVLELGSHGIIFCCLVISIFFPCELLSVPTRGRQFLHLWLYILCFIVVTITQALRYDEHIDCDMTVFY